MNYTIISTAFLSWCTYFHVFFMKKICTCRLLCDLRNMTRQVWIFYFEYFCLLSCSTISDFSRYHFRLLKCTWRVAYQYSNDVIHSLQAAQSPYLGIERLEVIILYTQTREVLILYPSKTWKW